MEVSFRQSNFLISRIGDNVTATKMHESNPHLSNSGTETNIGTSEFSRNNDRITEISVEVMTSIMEQDDDFAEISNSGSETFLSPSGFQTENDISFNAQQMVAARAYEYFK